MSRSAAAGRRTLPSVAPAADRRFRRADVPVGRRRLTRTVWRGARWAIPVLLMAGAVVWGGVVLAGSDALRVRDVVVVGNRQLTVTDVETLLQGIRGENILRVDLDAYAARVRDSAWVADASLFRVLPARVEVRLRERQPMAIARHAGHLYLVDDTGIIIDEYSARYRAFDLPVVDGLVTDASDGSLLVDPDRVRLTTGFLAAFRDQPALVRRFSQVDVSSARDARVLLDDDPAWLHLGQEDFAGRIRRYLEMRPTLHDRFDEIDYVDLRFDARVYVQGTHGRRTGAR
jgi:cell division septal protein FtsQ